ncbi:Rhs element Vgr protein [Azotobacter vinelandii CA]|uniref:Rhs element Vgr protein n=2 Tax=Azotobacter vinelandii TaxID=354 RepID=C1DJR7_AZOVD|nr:type VI secretion system tip protein TssI/VgrG [Azotobacter vinelandii]ACO78836.1 Rhs element Vgr protein [Azotobacter vinelandii DJ]AGK16590.1 Rhs element Vgr protein [Azotobacter vinelandii CA]AGK20788.1 Rhs element Vgr protein [Azotobacter vinelandii CA6]SFX31669.1 type VI secretion system secreted protein VgrG [Azotobacter vinelandii]GLK60058.1 hypothetical protein GCM10017624_22170 [Azotobacter vinelandii]
MDRNVKVHSVLGEDVLLFRAMTGTETLSQLFRFEVELLAESHSLSLKTLLGSALTLEIATRDEGVRYLNGLVTRCELFGREDRTARLYRYRATVRPWLWLLSRNRDCRIFQEQSVPEIVQAIFAKYSSLTVELSLTGTYRQWGYCVQYQESDFSFVSRLLEHEGIYYYFRHELGSHTLVLVDDIETHETFAGYESIPFFAADRLVAVQEECIDIYRVSEEMASGSYIGDDYNFTAPKSLMRALLSNPAEHEHSDAEVYEWLTGYRDYGEAAHYTRIRLEELQTRRELDEGHAIARGLAPGYRFTLRNCPREEANRDYLVVSVTYHLKEPGYASNPEPARYDFDFVTQPVSLPFRPRRITPKPRPHGPQTAVVVGPEGEEIWTDEYGRVKVQFHWDRYGQMNEESSCWIRVASSWAGSTFGGIYIPRIGQEVIVDFIGGEIDRPIVIGSTYNADQMPPFELPLNSSQSGIVTRTLEGTPVNGNFFYFEDRAGEELVRIKAERDHDTEVLNDTNHFTVKTHSLTVGDLEIAVGDDGGGATSNTINQPLSVAGGGNFNVRTVNITIRSAVNIDISAIKVGVAGVNTSLDGVKVAIVGVNTVYNGATFIRNETIKKEHNFYKSESTHLEHKESHAVEEKGTLRRIRYNLVNFSSGTFRADYQKKKDDAKQKARDELKKKIGSPQLPPGTAI